jgi:hypothetical protein
LIGPALGSLVERLSRALERRNWTFGLTEAAIIAVAGAAIASAVAYHYAG